MQSNAIQYNTIQYKIIHYNTMQCNTIQYKVTQYNCFASLTQNKHNLKSFTSLCTEYVYVGELQLNKANSSGTKAACIDLNLSISLVSTKIYDKRDNLILIQLMFRSLMAVSLSVPLMVLLIIYPGNCSL